MALTRNNLRTGTVGVGNIAGLALALHQGKTFWPCVGYLLLGGMVGGIAGTAVGAVAGLPEEAEPEMPPPIMMLESRPQQRAIGVRGGVRPGAGQAIPKATLLSGLPAQGPGPVHPDNW